MQEAGTIGVEVCWYWEETAARWPTHPAEARFGDGSEGNCWVTYSKIVAAQVRSRLIGGGELWFVVFRVTLAGLVG